MARRPSRLARTRVKVWFCYTKSSVINACIAWAPLDRVDQVLISHEPGVKPNINFVSNQGIRR